jgi:ubiquinone/menaquinone biosynthesis C-methylase UbiE
MNVLLPNNTDWRVWIKRWDRMQDRCVPARRERFETIVRLIADTQPKVSKVLDIGCGTGSLMLPILEAFPAAEIWGIDFDSMLLRLAEKRLAGFSSRVNLVNADLRKKMWTELVHGPFDAVVSATALHWFSPPQLYRLYKQFAQLLRCGGIFLNADPAGSSCKRIQKNWEARRKLLSRKYKRGDTDDWEGFWKAYGTALKIDIKKFHKRLIGHWVGSEQGLSLQWHFEKLKASGFAAIDCFWRMDYDAIYGGIRK